jgi:putative zinc finger/helix-turn-helix YgiT family protein
MEEHDVYKVQKTETLDFKNKDIIYEALYEYCEYADELLETEEMIKQNKLMMIDEYRKQDGLLTSNDLINIREKYSVSQKDFSEILDWGKATITRYENHQVQDRAHDDVLRMVQSDPKWFLDKLELAKERISNKAYNKYKSAANELYISHEDCYMIEAIEAAYASFNNPILSGNRTLSLKKVIDVINYLALNVKSLHKVKLMKLLWYSDNLNYKRYGHSITGLVYKALPMGAVPEAYEKIVELNNVNFEEISYEDYEYVAQKFSAVKDFSVQYLDTKEVEVLDTIIDNLGSMNKEEIVKKMHDEDAYINTEKYEPISFEFAEKLSID